MGDADRRASSGGELGFRRVLHEWASRQLAEKSGHAGPFEIVHVELDHDPGIANGSTFESETTSVRVRFRHDGSGCEESERRYYTRDGVILRDRCVAESWWVPDTTQTVSMINELLAIADGDEARG
jgi:hypothetical protein